MKLIKTNIFTLKKFLSVVKIFATFFGLSCFKYPSESYKLSSYGVLTMSLNLFFNFYQIYHTTKMMITRDEDLPFDGTSSFLIFIQNGVFVMSFMSAIIVIIISFVLRKEFFKMLKKFEEFDFEMQKISVEVNDFRIFRNFFAFIIFKLLSLILADVLMFALNGKYLTFFSFLFASVAIYAPIEIFIGLTYLFYRRLSYVVNTLR
jgi:hypothetical protein